VDDCLTVAPLDPGASKRVGYFCLSRPGWALTPLAFYNQRSGYLPWLAFPNVLFA